MSLVTVCNPIHDKNFIGIKPKCGVGVIIVKDNKVLLGKRMKCQFQPDTFAPPGGHLEFGETLEDACKREVKEETNLDITNLKRVKIYEDITSEFHYVCFLYSATLQDPDQQPTNMEPDKCEGWNWQSFDKLPQPLFRSFKDLSDSKEWPQLLGEIYENL